MTETGQQVIVDQPGTLHAGINHSRANEFEPALPQVLAQFV